VLRLLKALRHESPGIAETTKRLGVGSGSDAVAYVFKTLHTAHGGKMSLVRVLSGTVPEGAQMTGASGTADRASGVFKMFGQQSEKRGAAQAGEAVGLGQVD